MHRVTRKIRQGIIYADFEANALVVNYEVKTVSLVCHLLTSVYSIIMTFCQVQVDEIGRVMEVLERRPEIRTIIIKTWSIDMAHLAQDIVEKCRYIHPSRTEEVEQLLISLRNNTMVVSS